MTAPFDGRTVTDALELLRTGELTVVGRLADASNATLYCTVETGTDSAACVYKPVAGERPLWDFPEGTLAGREVAAFAVSDALGWDVVPPTVHRDGPFGEGMCQLWIDGDPAVDLVALSREREHAGLRRMAVFDAIINNSDRKIGHLLPVTGGHVYGCDHGVSFAEEYKLRTVLWQWQGEPLPPETLARLEQLLDELARPGTAVAQALARHLTGPERYATRRRVELLCEHGVHPFPSPDWPALPWPPI
ncbi:SCO1664 family protein [Marinitenerispora sediminis]|uniref:SCO1664 family protein n=1 Tax=Marinitenerispora sediminis TaxID=1931232 RepID=A0A368T9A7_9ACTN|nr:SCO1664 family protein [Marinitenerispora sediminis]RCV52422.1 SCO1664 family protein [Marinitenerispora sediminis]RCV60620.1 SCO1664 family protein [Marinitenerispora sediminis]RCV61093.1 SCO1664 family protein [Marinitenerispora sediminis]